MNTFVKLRGEGPIVLVDDDDADGWLLRRCYQMSALSNELIWLGSGLALVEYLREVASGAAVVPALIMLDLRMRGLEGLNTLQLIDAFSAGPAPDIVILTDSHTPAYLEAASRLGATAYLVKAEDPAETIEYFNSLAA